VDPALSTPMGRGFTSSPRVRCPCTSRAATGLASDRYWRCLRCGERVYGMGG